MGSLACRRSTQPGERPIRPCVAGASTLRPSLAEGQKLIAKVFDRAGAHIVEKAVIDGREAWTVECLYPREKNLVEVALQYQQPDWDLVAYEKFLNTEAEAPHIADELAATRQPLRDSI
jgi:hypothetical protein